MKLLFLWVNCSENGFIKKQGFNISGRYFFEYNNITNILSSKKKEGYIDEFWNERGNIEDLSAIVGSNGSGKSTLLSEVMGYGLIVPHELHGEAHSRAEIAQRSLFLTR